MTAQLEPLPVDTAGDALARLQRYVVLLSLTVGWPKLARRIDGAKVSLDVEGQEVDVEEDIRTTPQWDLMPEEWRSQFGRIEGRARAALRDSGVSFLTHSCMLVPLVKVASVVENLEAIRAEFDRVAGEFCSHYDTILADLRTKLGEKRYAIASRRLPTREELRSKFRLVWCEIPLDRGIRPESFAPALAALDQLERGSAVDASAVREQIERLQEQARGAGLGESLDAARAQLREQLDQAVEAMAREPRARIQEAVDRLIEAARGGDRTVRQATIEAARDAFDHARSFSFLADEELLRRIDEADRLLADARPREFNAGEVSEALTRALEGVSVRAADTAAADQAVGRFRAINPDTFEMFKQPATAENTA
jgi:hypothetical protein